MCAREEGDKVRPSSQSSRGHTSERNVGGNSWLPWLPGRDQRHRPPGTYKVAPSCLGSGNGFSGGLAELRSLCSVVARHSDS